MLNKIWSARIKDVNSRGANVVLGITVIESGGSTVEEFRVWLNRKFGEDRVVDFKETTKK